MTIEETLINVATLEDLNDKNREIAEIIGIDNLFAMCKWFGGGDKIYFRKLESVIEVALTNRIKREFNGFNALELAKRYKTSHSNVMKICEGYTLV